MREHFDKYCDRTLQIPKEHDDKNDIEYRTGSFRTDATLENDLFLMVEVSETDGEEMIRLLERMEFAYSSLEQGKYENGRHFGLYSLVLSAKGHDFITHNSFEEIRRKEKLNETIEQKNLAATEMSIQLNQYLIKTKWIPHIFAIISVIISIIALVQSCNK